MSVIRVISSGALVFVLAAACASEKIEPVAQVFEVSGSATALRSGTAAELKRGDLLGRDDSLTLESKARVALYFKNGVKKNIEAADGRLVVKVIDQLPRPQTYSNAVPLFGATRGRLSEEAYEITPAAMGFFYPQEAVIVEKTPSIEVAVFGGSHGLTAPAAVTVQVLENDTLVHSAAADGRPGAPGVFPIPALAGQREYTVKIAIGLWNETVSVSFPLYIAGPAQGAQYAAFSDPVYRSCESASVHHNGAQLTLTLIKQVANRSGSPVIAVELFIP